MTKINTSAIKIYVPVSKNKLLQKTLDYINSDPEIKTYWQIVNVNAIDRLGMSDHGQVHYQIVANSSLRLCRILVKNKIKMSIVKNYDLSGDYAELVIFLASLMHDLGMTIDREDHEEYSLFISQLLLAKTLSFLPIQERLIVTSETLQAIISHRSGGKPMTVEAGIVRVADALDMTKGRSRIPFQKGEVNIHSVSASAIESVEILEGKNRPIQINILMNNSAGIFQVDELLKKKLVGSGIEKYFEIKAYIPDKTEKALIKEFYLDKL